MQQSGRDSKLHSDLRPFITHLMTWSHLMSMLNKEKEKQKPIKAIPLRIKIV
jgi:hypothetical protein